jgi:hypothetical protein
MFSRLPKLPFIVKARFVSAIAECVFRLLFSDVACLSYFQGQNQGGRGRRFADRMSSVYILVILRTYDMNASPMPHASQLFCDVDNVWLLSILRYTHFPRRAITQHPKNTQPNATTSFIVAPFIS